MFDVTLTDSEFERDFVNKNADWLDEARPDEPDLEVEGLHHSLFSRVLALIGIH